MEYVKIKSIVNVADSVADEDSFIVQQGTVSKQVTRAVAELASEETKQKAETAGERAQENLDATDYKIVKCAELGLDVETTYPGLKAQRAAWRELVNAAR
jgi:Tat protein secretion system quality control protein TatD with DNase activity